MNFWLRYSRENDHLLQDIYNFYDLGQNRYCTFSKIRKCFLSSIIFRVRFVCFIEEQPSMIITDTKFNRFNDPFFLVLLISVLNPNKWEHFHHNPIYKFSDDTYLAKINNFGIRDKRPLILLFYRIFLWLIDTILNANSYIAL